MHGYVSPTGGVYLQDGPTSTLVGVMKDIPERGVSLINIVRKLVALHLGRPVDWKLAVGVSDEFWNNGVPHD
jgi:hypothetical protein